MLQNVLTTAGLKIDTVGWPAVRPRSAESAWAWAVAPPIVSSASAVEATTRQTLATDRRS